jgi:hypothetical protein
MKEFAKPYPIVKIYDVFFCKKLRQIRSIILWITRMLIFFSELLLHLRDQLYSLSPDCGEVIGIGRGTTAEPAERARHRPIYATPHQDARRRASTPAGTCASGGPEGRLG